MLDEVERWARQELEAKNAAREQALARSRELVRTCANSIRAVHRHDVEQARTLIGTARRLSDGLIADLSPYPDIFFAGYVQDAQKELVEALAVFSLVTGEPMPPPTELGVAPAPFLNGLGETVGELRRYVLDRLRRGDLDGCEALLQTMDDIYSLLVTVDYPDALTGGLRRTTDAARAILERTRGDLTFALRQHDLETSMRRLEAKIGATEQPAGNT
ncbi:MAG: haloacid dehalogenase [Chloroflexi bacterium]|nr:haloacid dehalogenase [Chloroflexota bacterium]